MAAALHGLFFLVGDFRPETPRPLNPRAASAVTIQLLESSHHADRPDPEALPPEPEQPALLAEKPGVVFESPTPRPMEMRTRTGRPAPVHPRALSAGRIPAKRPVIPNERLDSARFMPNGLPDSTPGSPKELIGEKPELTIPLVEAVPLYRQNPPPLYPELARRRGYEGVVLLEVLVTEEGSVGELRVARSSGHTVLDRAAVQTVGEWRFVPGRRGDLPVAMRVRIPVRFRLQ